jgi:hypothetical protein
MDGRPDAGAPERSGMRRHEESRFGFALEVPRRFIGLANSVDPIARALRHVDEGSGGDAAERERAARGAWPRGYCDPGVLGDVGGGRLESLRLLEIDVLRGAEPMATDEAAAFRAETRAFLPMQLEMCGLPGYRFAGVRDAELGPLDALAFDYRWDGASPGTHGDDHGLLLWALASTAVFHVYHHCPADLWDEYLPELQLILGSFRVLAHG